MIRPERTRLVFPLAALACAAALACQRADEQAPPATSAPATPLAPSLPPPPPADSRPSSNSSATATATAAAPPPAPVVKPPASTRIAISRVLVIGDSLSDERAGGGGFVKLLRERCPGVEFDNRAKGGYMVNQMRRRLEAEVLPQGGRYSHAIVFGGVNDLYSDQSAGRTLPRIQADLVRIYDMLRQRGVQVIAITVAPWGGFKRWYTPERGRNTLALNAWISEQVERGNIVAAVDAYPLLSCGEAELLCPELAAPHRDGLHFGKLGHQRLGEELARTVFGHCAAN